MTLIYTVEQVAERLKLHPKTVLRFVREGRLRATRVGKSYRIVASDLDAFLGMDAPAATRRAARVTSVLEVDDLDTDGAQKIATLLSAAIAGADIRPSPMQLTTAFDKGTGQLKIVVIGSPADTAQVLQLVQVQLENLR